MFIIRVFRIYKSDLFRTLTKVRKIQGLMLQTDMGLNVYEVLKEHCRYSSDMLHAFLQRFWGLLDSILLVGVSSPHSTKERKEPRCCSSHPTTVRGVDLFLTYTQATHPAKWVSCAKMNSRLDCLHCRSSNKGILWCSRDKEGLTMPCLEKHWLCSLSPNTLLRCCLGHHHNKNLFR